MFRWRTSDKTSAASDELPMRLWSLYLSVNDWIRHADSKASITLAFVGAAAAALVALLPTDQSPSKLLLSMAALCGLLLCLSALLGALAIWPRLGSDLAPSNPLYYQHIATRYGSPSEAAHRILPEIACEKQFSHHVASQIAINSAVATKKFKYVNWSVRFLCFSIATLAACVVIHVAYW